MIANTLLTNYWHPKTPTAASNTGRDFPTDQKKHICIWGHDLAHLPSTFAIPGVVGANPSRRAV
jgi:hypothetical protein